MAASPPATPPATRVPHAGWLSAPVSWRSAALVLVLAILAGLGIGWAGAGWDRSDRLSVGNTGNRLSTLIRVDGRTVVIGGSEWQDELAEFVDRSTLPWQRHVHLLVVPAADDDPALGALALVERGTVGAVAVLGTPGAEPVWTRLERAARDQGIEIRYLTGTQRISLGGNRELLLAAASGPDANLGAYAVLLRYGDVRVLIAHGGKEVTDATRAWLPVEGEIAAFVQLGAGDQRPDQRAAVLLRPRPQRSGDVAGEPPQARFVAELDRGERLTINLESNRLRLPLDSLTPVAQSTPPAGR